MHNDNNLPCINQHYQDDLHHNNKIKQISYPTVNEVLISIVIKKIASFEHSFSLTLRIFDVNIVIID